MRNKKLEALLNKLPLNLLEEVYLERQNRKLSLDEEVQDSLVVELKRYKVLVIPDLQIPAEHEDALEFCDYVYKKENCDIALNIGDEVDQHNLSFHQKDPNTFSTSQEFALARKKLQAWYKRFPKMYICHSNHGSLLYRQASANNISKDMVKSLKEMYGIGNGWKWANKIVFKQPDRPDIVFTHQLSGSAINNIKSYGSCVVQGHFHTKAEIIFQMLSTGVQLFGATVGSLVNRFHPFLSYARTQKELPRLGVLVIDNGSPKYIPMILDKKNRWIGRKKK